jgi:tRNA A37 methylthiotransferase MiaB
VKFDMAFLFAYSMREKTHAHRNYADDVPEEMKQRRLKTMIDTFVEWQAQLNQKEVGRTHLLLLEGRAKRDTNVLMGKTDNFKNGYVKIQNVPVFQDGKEVEQREFKIGDYLIVKVDSVGPRSLHCSPIGIAETLAEFETHFKKD